MRPPVAALLITLFAETSPSPGALPPASPAPAPARWPGAQNQAARLADAVVHAARTGRGDTLARLHRLANFCHLHRAPDALARAVAAVLEADRSPPLAKDHARHLRAQRLRREGASPRARAEISALGLATGGHWLGPFEHGAGAGFQAPHGPETGPLWSAQWRPLGGLAPDGVIRLGALAHPRGPGVGYVALAARAERRARVAVRIGATDAVKVWVNGAPALSKDVRRFAALDQEAVGVRLEPGLNWILVKLAWAADEADLMVRLTAPRGGPAAGVTWDLGKGALEAAAARFPLTAAGASSFVVTRPLDGLARARLGEAEALALRADLVAVLGLYDRRARPTEPERLLRASIDAAPDDPRLRFYFAHRIRDVDRSLSRAALRSALRADPGYAPAHLALGQGARDSGRLLEARRHLDRALEVDPGFAAAHLARASLGFEMLDEAALALARLQDALSSHEALQKQPLLHLQTAHMRRALGDAAGARAAAERTLALDATNPAARALAADLALEAGATEAALSHLATSIDLRPASLGLRRQRARVLAGEPGRLEAARGEVADATALFGHDPSLHTFAADLAARAGDHRAAAAALEAALALDPHQPDARRRLRALAGREDRLEDRYAIEAGPRRDAPVSEAEKSWGAIYLDDIEVVQLFENHKSARFRQSILRLHNPRLSRSLRMHQIPYAPSREAVEILAAERIRPSGEVIPASDIRDEGPRGKVAGMYIDQRYKLVLFDALEAGDLVHIQYRVDAVGENIFGGFFGDVSAVQEALPKRSSLYTVIAPEGRPLYTTQVGLQPPTVEQQGETKAWSWRTEDLPGLEPEPLAPPYPKMGRLASVSTYATWAELGAWYGHLYAEQMQLDDEARAAGRSAVADATQTEEKVRRLYGYVVANTRYVGIELGIHGWKPYPASEVHRRRYGDCKDKATLLAALLQDNGVKAALTLVRTVDRGRLPEGHATMWAFNHAITYVPELDLYLDPTAEFNGTTELPWADQGAMALVVHPDGRTKQVTLPSSEASDNLNASDYVATLRRDSSLLMQGEERFLGAPAADLRRRLQEPEQRVRELEAPLAQMLPGAKVESADFSRLADIEAPVSYRYTFSVPRYGRRDGETSSLPVALYRHQVAAAYATLAERRYDLHVTHPWKTRNVIRYRLPEGAKVDLPEGVQVDTPYISLQQSIRRTEDGFVTDDTVTFKRRVVPADAYPAFRAACLTIDRALGRQVVISW